MKIGKITFRNKKAWLAIYSEKGEQLGTWHVVDPDFVTTLKNEQPSRMKVWRRRVGKGVVTYPMRGAISQV